MKESIGIRGEFSLKVYEGESLISQYDFPNKILRCGLRGLVQFGLNLSQFNTFNIGSDSSPNSASYTGILSPLTNTVKVGSRIPEIVVPSWGFTTTYLPGEADGLWAEIGMSTQNHFYNSAPLFLNRARLLNEFGAPFSFTKATNQRVIAAVVFEIQRI